MLPAQTALALEELGWSSFQDLCIAFCEDIFRYPITSFSPTKDRGIDGIIEPIRGGKDFSDIVIQVKHTSSPDVLTVKMLAQELEKISYLHQELSIRRYVLITNHRLTVGHWLAIKKIISSLGIQSVLIVGRESIVRRVRNSPSLRGMVPRLYGIGDLSQILDERRLSQAKAMLAYAKSDLDKFVITESYRKSLLALRTTRILILLGDPAVGKTTIARCLAMASVDEFDASPMVLENVADISTHWNPDDHKRLFWIDDTFGPTQRDDAAIQTFNKLIPLISTATKSGSRFIFTSRSYIWHLSKGLLKLSGFPGYDASRVEIDVRRFTEFERAQIVYNHVKLGDQPDTWKTQFKHLFPIVARHPSFKPEVARRLGLRVFTNGLQPVNTSIDEFVKNPGAFLEDTIRSLDAASQAALTAVLMASGSLRSPLEPSDALDSVCNRFGVSHAEVAKRLSAMEGAFFRLEADEGEHTWRFSHPTIGEAMAAVAVDDIDLLDVYLHGTPINKMLSEIVCVGRQLKGAVIKISGSRYGQLIDRIRSTEALPTYVLLNFLAYRTDESFRRKYFAVPLGLSPREFGYYQLTSRPVLDLTYLLWGEKLISEELLGAIRSAIRDGITSNADIDCLDPGARLLLGETEFQAAAATAIDNFRDDPWSIISTWEENLEEDVDPADHFHGIQAFFDKLITAVNLQESEEADEISDHLRDRISERSVEIDNEREERAKEDRDIEEMPGLWNAAAAKSPPTKVPIASKLDPLIGLFSDVDLK